MTITPMMITMSMMTAMMFTNLNHPMAMGLNLMVQATLVATLTGMMAKSFWFSYILFLIFMGGMMVLFIYIASLAPNEMFSINSNWTMMLMAMTLLMMLTSAELSTMTMSQALVDTSSTETIGTQMTAIMKIYTTTLTPLTTLIISYLFLTLIVVVKITNLPMGPMRMKK